MSKYAVILAGGKGSRLRPYTVVLPKPLMPVGEYPILEVVIRQLVGAGFTQVTMAVNHQADVIKAFFGDGSKWGVRIQYSLEDQPLGTMGPLKIIPDLPEDFLVMNGDVLTDLDFGELIDFHVRKGNLFTIAAHQRDQQIDYGVLQLDGDDQLKGFMEKPVQHYNVSMGVYAVSRKVLEYIPPGQNYGFDKLMLDLLRRGLPVSVRLYAGYWLDIGRPDDYMQAIEEFDRLRDRFLKP
jgi:NDP-sugar pyrophosphorylase family protein